MKKFFLFKKLVSFFTKKGNQSKAFKILASSFFFLKQRGVRNVESLFLQALLNVSPKLVLVKKIQKRKINFIPIRSSFSTRAALGLKWLVLSSKKNKTMPVYQSFGEELLKASKGNGDAIQIKLSYYRKLRSKLFLISKIF